MAWQGLKQRFGEDLAQLPLVLAGPILRRTDSTTVSVWIACKKKLSLSLEVYKPHENRQDKGDKLLSSTYVDTFQIGDNLHIAVIQAIKKAGDTELEFGKTYLYDIAIQDGDNIFGLDSPGVLFMQNETNTQSKFQDCFCYKGFKYPSFILPAKDIKDVRIVHGSCRKPHGDGQDALVLLDTLIEFTTNSTKVPETERPQLLLLTGDQIYADDVSDTLLTMLIDAGEALMGNQENVEGLKEDDYKVGKRQVVSNEKLGFSSEEAKSHLLKFREFCMMYLFVWSDVLWPVSDKDIKEVINILETDTKILEAYIQEVHNLIRFKKSIIYIRKALANTPTYMIFDDHEITDDWYLNYSWIKGLKDPGIEVILNGLAAYSIFQAWGNYPTEFEEQIKNAALPHSLTSSINEFFSYIKNINSKPEREKLYKILLPKWQNNESETDGNFNLGFTWHFYLQYPVFNLIFLDTRTQRKYTRLINTKFDLPAELIMADKLKEQLPKQQNSNITFIVSPSPVFGNLAIEDLQNAINIILKLSDYIDFEAWGLNYEATSALLENISQYERVVILSGDVHYAFSKHVSYWNLRENPINRYASFVQLCSSAIKNQDIKTKTLGSEDMISSVDLLALLKNYAGNIWSLREYIFKFSPSGIANDILLSVFEGVYYKNFKNHTNEVYNITVPEKEALRIDCIADPNPALNRNALNSSISDIHLYKSHNEKELALSEIATYFETNRFVVGYNNIGLISFSYNEQNQVVELEHRLYFYEKVKGSEARITTQHTTPFKVPNDSTPKPE